MNAFSGLSLPGSSFAGLARAMADRFPARGLRLAAVLAVTTVLAACGSAKGPPQPCPAVLVQKELGYMTQFGGNGQDLSDIAYEAHIDTFSTYCVYSRDQDPNYIRTAIKLQLAATRGPKFSGDKASFKYFVAITGPGGERLKKDVFDVDVDFSKGQVSNITIDEIDPIKVFPKPNENGDFYRVYIGLDLTKDQLDYNKRNPRQ